MRKYITNSNGADLLIDNGVLKWKFHNGVNDCGQEEELEKDDILVSLSFLEEQIVKDLEEVRKTIECFKFLLKE